MTGSSSSVHLPLSVDGGKVSFIEGSGSLRSTSSSVNGFTGSSSTMYFSQRTSCFTVGGSSGVRTTSGEISILSKSSFSIVFLRIVNAAAASGFKASSLNPH